MQLQRDGFLGNLADVATKFGVSTTAIGQWERGETWPKGARRARVAEVLGWSEHELDHGPQPGEVQEDMAFHPVDTRELEVLALYRALGADQGDFLHKLRAKVATRQTLQHNMKAPLRTVSDAEVRDRMPVTTPAADSKPTKPHKPIKRR